MPRSLLFIIRSLSLFQVQTMSYSNTLTLNYHRLTLKSNTLPPMSNTLTPKSNALVPNSNALRTIQKSKREFCFPTMSYKRGLRNIHNLEYILNKSKHFHVSNITEPIKCGGNYIILSARCSSGHKYNNNFMLFSNQSNVSNIVYLKDGVPRLTLLLSVRPSYIGHILSIHVTYFRHPKLYAALLKPLWIFFKFSESLTFVSYNYTHNDNLRKYRVLLFNKTDDEI
jgi:hypothetical protein